MMPMSRIKLRGGFEATRWMFLSSVSLIFSGLALLALGGPSSRYAIGFVLLAVGIGLGVIGIRRTGR